MHFLYYCLGTSLRRVIRGRWHPVWKTARLLHRRQQGACESQAGGRELQIFLDCEVHRGDRSTQVASIVFFLFFLSFFIVVPFLGKSVERKKDLGGIG